MSLSSWTNLAKQLGGDQLISKLNQAFKSDEQFLAFTNTAALSSPISFGITSTASSDSILIHICSDSSFAYQKSEQREVPLFSISALPEQWEQFFQKIPPPGFQNYWGMLRYNMHQTNGAKVLGSEIGFARHTHIVRRVLELIHEIYCGKHGIPTEDVKEAQEQDFIQGHYIWLTLALYGRCKVFVEQSGDGAQDILFLHTAGADSRQYHTLMNDDQLRQSYRMTAFDLPSHGRSFPASSLRSGAYTLNEDAYIAAIAAVIKAEALNRPILVGASMAGQICLAVAIRNAEVRSGGVIPLEACDYIERDRQWNDKSPLINSSLFNPEAIYGLCAPTAPKENKQLIWHMYSAQAYGIFHGDLDLYNQGWDGRSRMETIDTRECPVYMLTGEYDYSTTPDMSRITAEKIPGARFETMTELGHFPATENPKVFKSYLINAVEWIQGKQNNRKGS
ncbi:MAG: hypothetical protein M1822_008696 [Bathelium mastoideum]|nr:MAG: hypothetical protein M1822_008696 [Bathelium mastoideum]